MYEELDLRDVQTYLQSGNVLFSAEKTDVNNLAKTISSRIEKDFGFYVPVLVLSVDQLASIIADNPFAHHETKESAFLHITFLADSPGHGMEKKIAEKTEPGERVIIAAKAVYLYCPNGYGKTKLHNGFLENTLKVVATTRNWKTANELLKLGTG